MKAVILAGGRGTRLSPLTLTVPKPLVVLGDRPILFHLLERLESQGIDEVIITLGYLGEKIEEAVRDYKTDIKISFSYEKEPLGKAGAVKNAVKNINEDFLVLSADAYCEFDFKSIYSFHKLKKSPATIVTTKVNDPREYGLVLSNENSLITRFLEKPGWSQAITDMANTGVYVLSEKALEYVPEQTEFDFSKNLFPLLIKNGVPVYSYEEKGYWCDVGDIKSYLDCNSYVLSKIKKTDSVPRGDFKVSNFVYTGNNVTVGNNSEIGKNTVICDNAVIGKNTLIKGSIIYGNCEIGDNCIIENSVVSADAKIGDRTRIYPLCCIGEKVKIGNGSSVFSSVRIKNGVEVCECSSISRSVEKSVKTDYVSSVSNSFIPDVDCFFSLELGCATGSAFANSKIAVATDGSPKAKSMLYSFVSGVGQSTAQSWLFGDSFWSQMFFYTYFCSLPLGVFFYGDGDTVNVKLCSTGGLPLTREAERNITRFLKSKDYIFSEGDKIKHPVEMNSVVSMYSSVLFRQSESSLSKMKVKTDTENERILFLLEDCIRRLEGETGDGIILHISNDGTNISVTENNIDYSPEDILSVLLYYETKSGRDVSLEFFSPQVYSSVASLHNRQVYRYLSSSADSSDSEARERAVSQLWTRDALFTAIRLLSLMHEENKSFSQLKRDVPDFYLSKGETGIDYSPTKLFDIFSDSDNLHVEKEGISFIKHGAKAIVVPDTDGRKIKVLTESFDTETAKELCDELIDKIRSFSDGSST